MSSLNWHVANFADAEKRHSILHPNTFLGELDGIMGRLREHDPRIKRIYDEVLGIGTGHKKYNKNKDTTLAVLGHLGAISEKTYSKIKNGKSSPSRTTVAKICVFVRLDTATMERLNALAVSEKSAKAQRAYDYMLNNFCEEERTIAFCNQFLTASGIEDEYLFSDV